MTVHIIDAANPLPPTHGDGETALLLNDRDIVVLASGSEIAAHGQYTQAIQGGLATTMMLDGRVFSGAGTAIYSHGTVNVGARGEVSGHLAGVVLSYDFDYGRPNVVINAGTISGAHAGAVAMAGRQNFVTNSGEIIGETGISTSAGILNVTNSGLIRGTDFAIRSTGPAIIVNTGRIEGYVILNSSAGTTSLYDGRGGTLTNAVYFSNGDDVAYGGDGAECFALGLGTNLADGGAGVDLLMFDEAGTTVDLRLTTRQQTTAGSWDTIRNIEDLSGSSQADHFIGNEVANTLAGNSGNDALEGNGGDDVLRGWAGSDELSGGDGTDIAGFNGLFSDYMIERLFNGSVRIVDKRDVETNPFYHDGTDILTGIEYAQFADRTIALTATTNSAPTFISLDDTSIEASAKPGALVGRLSGVDPDGDALGYFLAANPGNHFRIHGDQLLVDKAFAPSDKSFDIVVRASDPKGASLDMHFLITVTANGVTVLPSDAPSEPSAHPEARVLRGGRKADILAGGDGDDHLNGGLGKDRMTGGEGDDVFAFTTRLGKANVDRILDFSSSEDAIHLSSKIFGRLAKGALSEEAFHIGAKAAEADDRIIFNKRTGALSYDADGSGTQYGAIKFAQLKAKTELTADDFFIV
ncbi:hypothetical protein KHP60_17005 [Microvirga sp. 3-52]|uniref:calcium-binding protein n=1 Tax=Microvirga sp. 3-52 TaxID=2792425 RepID=UPI001ACB0A26|nr:calcium-binding protein [Microvirga sp. 3-52]MBO1906934.1 hypothetical protein [Microvirga sp. 3-52]MBS7454031.1 hypothetical protein [Microvirga sp. 3-52]